MSGIFSDKQKPSVKAKETQEIIWEMKELKYSFFFVCAAKSEEVFFENDELLATIGSAYESTNPLTVISVLNTLEEVTPDFRGVTVKGSSVELKRRRDKKGGISIIKDGQINDFISEKNLEQMCFFDLYLKLFNDFDLFDEDYAHINDLFEIEQLEGEENPMLLENNIIQIKKEA